VRELARSSVPEGVYTFEFAMDMRRRPAAGKDSRAAESKEEENSLDCHNVPRPQSKVLQQFEELDCFLVKQDLEYFEALTGIETQNSYQVLGATGSSAILGPVCAKESSGFISRMACGNRRPWTIRLGEAPHLLLVERPFRFFMQEVRVRSGPERLFLGSVRRECYGYPLLRNFTIYDAMGAPYLRLTCPFFSFGWTFTLRDLDGNEMGKITKRWAGVMQELFTDADNFGAGFPRDLPTDAKALVLGAVFLIDFCFFEDNEVQKNSGGGRSSSRRW